MAEGDVAGLARRGGEREAHETGALRHTCRPERLQRQHAALARLLRPVSERVRVRHQRVGGGERGRLLGLRLLLGQPGLSVIGVEPRSDRPEAVLLEEGAERTLLRLTACERFQRHRQRCIPPQRHELAGETRHLGMLDQVLAALGLLDLFGAFQQPVEVTIVVDELRRRLDADAGHARHVVGAVARQRLHVNHPLRIDAEAIKHLFRADLAVLEVVVHDYRVAFDELHQVLVGGDDGDPRAPRAGSVGVGRDQVVGLEALKLDRRQVEGAGGLADEGELRNQLLRRLAPVRLVGLVDLVAEGEPRGVENYRGVVRIGFPQDLPEHVGEAEDRIDRRAVWAGEGGKRVKGAEDKARAVDQV